MDRDPVEYLERNDERLTDESRAAAARRLGMHRDNIAIVESTTVGVGLVYGGLKVREGQELLTTEQDYYVTHESLRGLARRTGAVVRMISPFDRVAQASEAGIVARIAEAITPRTRLVALTWVQSNTGLKMPVAAVAAHLAEVNAGRDEADQVLLGLDAVHGFGIEPDHLAGLGCDFLMAGCHKWLFGPRGTGIIAFSERGLRAVEPVVPTFDDSGVFSAWYAGQEERPSNNGRQMTPGGFKAFEHRWALAEAFRLHEEIGVARIAARTRELAGALKDGLAGVRGVTVVTPRSERLSAGIVAFRAEGVRSGAVVRRLRERGVIASVAPYPSQLVRLTPSIINSEAEIEAAVAAVRASV
nr:aminotransferase class V-fold PLP-dependent enzyme [Rubellimicrobium aerolatum]